MKGCRVHVVLPGVGLGSVCVTMAADAHSASSSLSLMPGNLSRHVVQVDTSSVASWEWNFLILALTAGWWRRGCAEAGGGWWE